MPDPGVIEVVGKGLAAGVVGTAAMTLSEKIEQTRTGREDTMVTAEVGAIFTKPRLQTGAQAAKLGEAVHWIHGHHLGCCARPSRADSAQSSGVIEHPLCQPVDERRVAVPRSKDATASPQMGKEATSDRPVPQARLIGRHECGLSVVDQVVAERPRLLPATHLERSPVGSVHRSVIRIPEDCRPSSGWHRYD